VIGSVVGFIGGGLMLLGLALATIGLFGMFRRPAIFEQLHAAGLVTGPGVVLVLLGSLGTGKAEIATSAILVIAFVLVTSSLSTHAIALAAWRVGAGAAGPGPSIDVDEPAAATPIEPSGRPGMQVVLAHDGSPSADTATQLVASLAWGPGAEIRIVGAIEGDIQPASSSEGPPGAADGAPDLAEAVATAAGHLRATSAAVSHVLRRGDPAGAIAAEAAALEADLVVVGSRGLGPVQALLAGSVVEAVLDTAPGPVLVARGPAVRSVLLATDGSETSDAAIEVVARWPMFEDVPVRVLSVATNASHYGDVRTSGTLRGAAETARRQRVADAAAMRLRKAGRRAMPRVRSGDAVATIRSVARAESVDLIVVGSRGRTGLGRILLGSVARDVLSSTDCSVLIVRPASASPDRSGLTTNEPRAARSV
jgi:monovalent cation/proton antiporter MnhG/PhaG subunit